MQEKSDEHTLLYERVCDILKGINVEKAEARNREDRKDIMDRIKTRFGLKHFLDVFSARQGAKGDFKLDYIEELITKIGLTLVVAEPWAEPDTIKRIWCVFKVLCTVECQTELSIAKLDKEEHRLMQNPL